MKTCEGGFAATTFGHTVERLTGQYRLSVRNRHEIDYQSANLKRCDDLKDIANVLSALFDMSQSRIHSITMSGIKECSFIDDLAKWLFDFEVEVGRFSQSVR